MRRLLCWFRLKKKSIESLMDRGDVFGVELLGLEGIRVWMVMEKREGELGLVW